MAVRKGQAAVWNRTQLSDAYKESLERSRIQLPLLRDIEPPSRRPAAEGRLRRSRIAQRRIPPTSPCQLPCRDARHRPSSRRQRQRHSPLPSSGDHCRNCDCGRRREGRTALAEGHGWHLARVSLHRRQEPSLDVVYQPQEVSRRASQHVVRSQGWAKVGLEMCGDVGRLKGGDQAAWRALAKGPGFSCATRVSGRDGSATRVSASLSSALSQPFLPSPPLPPPPSTSLLRPSLSSPFLPPSSTRDPRTSPTPLPSPAAGSDFRRGRNEEEGTRV